MYIYICGIIGYSEAASMLEGNRDLIESRLPQFYLCRLEALEAQHRHIEASMRKIIENQERLCQVDANNMAGSYICDSASDLPRPFTAHGEANISPMIIELGVGGVYRGLWELGVALNCGIEADILNVPVRQEVVEIMEIMNADPYEADCTGCFLIAAQDAATINANFKSAVIQSAAQAADSEVVATAFPPVTISVTNCKNRAQEHRAQDSQQHLVCQTMQESGNSSPVCTDEAQNILQLTCIGQTTSSKARIVKMPDGIRYLTPPGRQDKDAAVKKSAREKSL